MKFLSDSFIDKYKDVTPPMTELGMFVYYRTYSRWLDDEKRREYWYETCRRAIDYIFTLEGDHREQKGEFVYVNTLRKEAEVLFDNMFNLRQFPSGRTLWVGGTEVATKFPTSNFNCSYVTVDDFGCFSELYYLLMVGTGAGFRSMPHDVVKIPSYRTDIVLDFQEYKEIPKPDRRDLTDLMIRNQTAVIIVGDSKEGWVSALDLYFKIHTSFLYRKIDVILMDFNNVRPKGERLITFGGTASGHESVKDMFNKIHKVLSTGQGKLRTIDVLDIANIIGENVVVGGVRRTAEMNIASVDDIDIETAKQDLYTYEDDHTWVINPDIVHRTMSNNSILFEKKPDRQTLHKCFANLRFTGERGFINAEAAKKRREDFEGVNPCGEVLLRSRGMCNLTTVNCMAFVKDGILLLDQLRHAFKLSTRIGIRLTLVDLEIPQWDEVQKQDRLIGCSMTGFYDMVDAIDLSLDFQKNLLEILRGDVSREAKRFCEELGINIPLLATTIKPEGSLSQLPTVSSGIHRAHSPYFIRRVRITAHDPLAKVVMSLGYPCFPENGETWDNLNTIVVEFPIKSPVKKTKHDVTAIEQLETYKMFQENYTQHNTSITVTVRENEWKDVEQWIWDNWDDYVAVSFLSLDDNVYQQAPYEAITEEEYNERIMKMKPFDISLLHKMELSKYESDAGDTECAGGACPIR
jgi:ribonucleoside-diphosphate reductase alpha chain/ribonucleoside-triphosphate reductase